MVAFSFGTVFKEKYKLARFKLLLRDLTVMILTLGKSLNLISGKRLLIILKTKLLRIKKNQKI